MKVEACDSAADDVTWNVHRHAAATALKLCPWAVATLPSYIRQQALYPRPFHHPLCIRREIINTLQTVTHQPRNYTAVTMDEDLLALIVVMGVFVTFPLGVVLFTTGCIAYSRTKKWDKERNLKAVNAESSEALIDDEDDFLDSDDEEEYTAKKAEEENDKILTFKQKFRKEFRAVWSGKGREQIIKEREREERKKLAKAVAKELERRERRRARKAERQAGFEAAPPSYKN